MAASFPYLFRGSVSNLRLNNMKVLISNPPWPGSGYGARSDVRWPHRRSDKYLEYPIYLAYAVAILKEAGVDVEFIDGVAEELSTKAYVEAAKEVNPEIVFLECSTPSINHDLSTAKKLKDELQGIFVAFIGPHPTYFHKETLKEHKFVDAIVRGEFDYTIRDLSLTLLEGKELNGVDGVSYRDKNRIYVNKDRSLIQNLDALPFPARDKVKSHSYREAVFTGKKCTTIVSSRGCPYRCVFCLWPRVMYGRNFRARSAGNVVDEVEHVVEKYGVDEIYFDDDCLTLNKKRLMKICKGIRKRGVDVKWMCQSRVDNVDEELLREMKRAGCHYIKYGVESGSQEMLNLMKKGITLEDAQRAFRSTRKIGIKTQAFFLIGLPWETEETFRDTVEFAKELKPDSAQFAVAVPHPGTELYDLCKEKGWLRFNSWEDFDCRKPVIETKNLSLKDVEKYRTEAYRKFYFRPSYILRTTLKLWNLKEARRIIRSARSIIERLSYYKEET